MTTIQLEKTTTVLENVQQYISLVNECTDMYSLCYEEHDTEFRVKARIRMWQDFGKTKKCCYDAYVLMFGEEQAKECFKTFLGGSVNNNYITFKK